MSDQTVYVLLVTPCDLDPGKCAPTGDEAYCQGVWADEYYAWEFVKNHPELCEKHAEVTAEQVQVQ